MGPSQLLQWSTRAVAISLGLRIVLVLADFSAAQIALWAPGSYDQIGKPLDWLNQSFHFPAMILFVLSDATWLYQFHRELGLRFGDYPIKPWGSVARSFVPIYHYWGVWNTFDTLERKFESMDPPRFFFSIRAALVLLYIQWLGMSQLNRIPGYKEWIWNYPFHESVDIGVQALLIWVASRALGWMFWSGGDGIIQPVVEEQSP